MAAPPHPLPLAKRHRCLDAVGRTTSPSVSRQALTPEVPTGGAARYPLVSAAWPEPEVVSPVKPGDYSAKSGDYSAPASKTGVLEGSLSVGVGTEQLISPTVPGAQHFTAI